MESQGTGAQRGRGAFYLLTFKEGFFTLLPFYLFTFKEGFFTFLPFYFFTFKSAFSLFYNDWFVLRNQCLHDAPAYEVSNTTDAEYNHVGTWLAIEAHETEG